MRIRSLLILASEPRVALAMTALLALIVGIATLTPQEHMPPAPGSDKLHHFLAFGALAFPMAFARPRAAIWVVLLVSLYGALIEVIQPHVGRHGDVMDAIANAAGAICGSVLGPHRTAGCCDEVRIFIFRRRIACKDYRWMGDHPFRDELFGVILSAVP